MKTRKIVQISAFLVSCCLLGALWNCGPQDGTWVPGPDLSGKRDGFDQVTFFEDLLQPGGSVGGNFTRDLEAHGWWFEVRDGARIALEVTHLGTSTGVDASLYLYGPLDPNGSLGQDPIAWNCAAWAAANS